MGAHLHSRLQHIYRKKKMGHKASLVGATHHHHDTPLQHHHHHTPLQQMYRYMGISAGRHSDLQQLYHLMGLGYHEGYRESSSYTNKYNLPALSLSAAPEEQQEEEQEEQQQQEEAEEEDHSDLLTTGPMVGNNTNTDVITMQWDGADFIIQDLLQIPIVKHREGNNTEPEPETEEISNDQSQRFGWSTVTHSDTDATTTVDQFNEYVQSSRYLQLLYRRLGHGDGDAIKVNGQQVQEPVPVPVQGQV